MNFFCFLALKGFFKPEVLNTFSFPNNCLFNEFTMNKKDIKENPVVIIMLSCPNNIKMVHARASCHL